jgi:ATP-binding cassette, subfamily B, bacterial
LSQEKELSPMAGSSRNAVASEDKKPSLKALRPLLPYALVYHRRILVAILALIVASAATLAVPEAVRRMIDHGFTNQNNDVIASYFLMLIALVAVLAVASSLRYYCVITLGERVAADIREGVFRHLTFLDAAFFDVTRSGELISRLSADTTQVKSAFGASVSIALRNAFLFFGAAGLMIWTSPYLSFLALMAIPAIVIPLVFTGRSVQRRSKMAQDRLADATAYASEALGAVKIVQAFNMGNHVSEKFGAAAEDAYEAARASVAARAWLTGAIIFLVFTSVIGVLWYGAAQVQAGSMTPGRLSQFILYAVFAASALGQLSEVYGELLQAAGAAERLADILKAEASIVAPVQPRALPKSARGSVQFDHVSFTYNSSPDQPSLHDVSFSLAAGERVALVGPSGAGKSTVLSLLLRFYDPQKGVITIDDIPVQDLDPADLRRSMALVPQDPVIFGLSVADNIRYGRMEASLEEVYRAAELAQASSFIDLLPQGYETVLGERGLTLSGGQRQRIAIARAILKNAPILLLDEATSALDAESEKAVQDALDRLMQGRTSLVIAHRLATIRSADRILVMDKGRIVEEGTHETLVNLGGLYARLAQLQFVETDSLIARST